MTKEELILNNTGLINMCIKDMNLYWNTEDEWQDYYDSGLVGLIKGAEKYDETMNVAHSTYLCSCIRNEISHFIAYKSMKKRTATITSLDKPIHTLDSDETTLLDLIPDNRGI